MANQKLISSLTFRQIYQQLVYIEDKNTLNLMKMAYEVPSKFDETGILAYGYIDSEEGLSFNVFSLVKMQEGQIIEFNDEPMKQKINHRLRLEDVMKLEGQALSLDPDILMNYVDRAVEINEKNFISMEVEGVRTNEQIDPYRHPLFPDDVECFVYDASAHKIEALWAKTQAIADNGIIAKTLTPISKNFNLAMGSEIKLNLYNVNDSIRLIHMINS